MRISDWSSDVCSSDLHLAGAGGVGDGRAGHAGEDDALEDVDLGEPTAEAAYEGVAEAQQPVGHGADVHQLRREDEQRHRQDDVVGRSEEHTSELQSLMRISYAVFCLKKKSISKYT